MAEQEASEMQYVYSALLLHSAGKEVSEAGVSKVLQSAGVNADTQLLKRLMVKVKNVNIDDAIAKAAIVQVAAAPAGAGAAEVKEKPKEEEKKTEEEAASGLSALFG